MATASSSTAPVTMKRTSDSTPIRLRPAGDRLQHQDAEQRGVRRAAAAEEAGAADDGRRDRGQVGVGGAAALRDRRQLARRASGRRAPRSVEQSTNTEM